MSEDFININGVKIWTATQGDGVPVLLCLGGPGCSDYLGPVADMISGISRTIRYEQRGCGRSDRIPPYDIDTELKDIEAIRDFYGVDRWIVGGHSWGANLALAYALAYREKVLGLIYISGPGIQHDIDWSVAKEKGRQERGEKRPAASLEGDEEVQRQLIESWNDFIKTPDLWKNISQLDVPALFVYGKQDIRPVWPVLQLANLMPSVQLRIMDGEHFMWLTQAEELKSFLREFIQGI
jgi:proline iminopeptidase